MSKKPTYKWSVVITLTLRDSYKCIIADNKYKAEDEALEEIIGRFMRNKLPESQYNVEAIIVNEGEYTYEDTQECP